jgi:hypothetical protein
MTQKMISIEAIAKIIVPFLLLTILVCLLPVMMEQEYQKVLFTAAVIDMVLLLPAENMPAGSSLGFHSHHCLRPDTTLGHPRHRIRR